MYNWRKKLWFKVVAFTMIGVFLSSDFGWAARNDYRISLPNNLTNQQPYQKPDQGTLKDTVSGFLNRITRFLAPDAYAFDFSSSYGSNFESISAAATERFNSGGYSAPSYSAPSYSAPSYSAPSFSAPSYSSQTYSNPTYQSVLDSRLSGSVNTVSYTDRLASIQDSLANRSTGTFTPEMPTVANISAKTVSVTDFLAQKQSLIGEYQTSELSKLSSMQDKLSTDSSLLSRFSAMSGEISPRSVTISDLLAQRQNTLGEYQTSLSTRFQVTENFTGTTSSTIIGSNTGDFTLSSRFQTQYQYCCGTNTIDIMVNNSTFGNYESRTFNYTTADSYVEQGSVPAIPQAASQAIDLSDVKVSVTTTPKSIQQSTSDLINRYKETEINNGNRIFDPTHESITTGDVAAAPAKESIIEKISGQQANPLTEKNIAFRSRGTVNDAFSSLADRFMRDQDNQVQIPASAEYDKEPVDAIKNSDINKDTTGDFVQTLNRFNPEAETDVVTYTEEEAEAAHLNFFASLADKTLQEILAEKMNADSILDTTMAAGSRFPAPVARPVATTLADVTTALNNITRDAGDTVTLDDTDISRQIAAFKERFNPYTDTITGSISARGPPEADTNSLTASYINPISKSNLIDLESRGLSSISSKLTDIQSKLQAKIDNLLLTPGNGGIGITPNAGTASIFDTVWGATSTTELNCAVQALQVLLPNVPADQLVQELAPYTYNGYTSLTGLEAVAQAHGKDYTAISLGSDPATIAYKLSTIGSNAAASETPFIAHLDSKHFVAVTGVEEGSVNVTWPEDGGTGQVSVTGGSVTYMDNGVEKTSSLMDFGTASSGFMLVPTSWVTPTYDGSTARTTGSMLGDNADISSLQGLLVVAETGEHTSANTANSFTSAQAQAIQAEFNAHQTTVSELYAGDPTSDVASQTTNATSPEAKDLNQDGYINYDDALIAMQAANKYYNENVKPILNTLGIQTDAEGHITAGKDNV
ncbi:MAG TPA: hypothetical protein PK562_04015, partial [Candidatus Omnitrophota bacterium]|nr:hypothetical protein [Candidatus Omnitrophota bacterium]